MPSVGKNLASFLTRKIVELGVVSRQDQQRQDGTGRRPQPIQIKNDEPAEALCGYLSDEELIKIIEGKTFKAQNSKTKNIFELFNAAKIEEVSFDLDKDGDVDAEDLKAFVKNCSELDVMDKDLEAVFNKISDLFAKRIQENIKGVFNKLDVNGDGKVNTNDVLLLSAAIARKDKNYDLNGDGKTDGKDLQFILKSKVSGLTLAQYLSKMMSSTDAQLAKLDNLLNSLDIITDDPVIVPTPNITDNTDDYIPTVSDKPYKSGNEIVFINNSKVKISSNESAVINQNGTVSVANSKNNTMKIYNAYGTQTSSLSGSNVIGHYNVNTNCLEFDKNVFATYAASSTNKIQLKNGDVVKENSDGSFTITNGSKVVKYSANGVVQNSDVSEYDYYMSKLKSLGLASRYNLSLPSNYSGANKHCDLSEAVKADIDMLIEADKYAKTQSNYQTAFNNYVASQMVKDYTKSSKSDREIVAETQTGDVIEKSTGLYVNDNGVLVKLNMTKTKYLELFPPVTRFSTEQNDIGDCYFISGVLLGCMENPATYAKILQMISVDQNRNVTIRFDGMSNYPVTFPNGNLYTADGLVNGRDSNCGTTQVTGAKGIKLLEQAFAIARFAQESTRNVSGIDIDAAYSYIEGGNNDEAQNRIFGSGFAKKKYLQVMSNSQIARLLDSYADSLQNGEIVLGAGTYYYASDKEYYVAASHAYSIESIDKANQTVTFINPWTGGVAITIPYSKFYEYFDVLYVGDLENL